METAFRKKFLQAYVDNAVSLLQANGDTSDRDLLVAYVKKQIRDRYKPLLSTVVANKNYGNAELIEHVDALKFFNHYNNKVLAPSGSVYHTIGEKKSVMYEFIKNYLTQRKILKKEMLHAEEKGDETLAQIKNYGQATVKIRANSLIGATGSEYSFCYNKAAFNSVTSMSRNLVMNAYAFTERFLAGNFYFPTYNHLLNYCSLIWQKMPPIKEIREILTKYKLYVPTLHETTLYFRQQVEVYTNQLPERYVTKSFLASWNAEQLAFLFYSNNFYQIATKNVNVLRSMVREVFKDIDEPTEEQLKEIKPTDLFECDGDLLIVLNTHYCSLLPEGVSLYDTPKKEPELAKKLVYIAKYMTEKINAIMEIVEFFCNNGTTIEDILKHKMMYRKVVANSDTDSVIFSTKDWVEWYTGNYNFTSDAFDIDVFITYCLSKSVAWLMYNISQQRGAQGKDLYAMNMKNEFLYPVLISCTIPKHYAGPITMREGVILAKPKFDIKGVSFRGSSMQKITLDYTENFIRSMIDDIYRKDHPEELGKIDIQKYITKVIWYESHILRSLRNGETTYLNVDPVKTANEYKDPNKSIYFNYQFWCEVFQDKYGEIQIPTKCHVVPLDPIGIKSDQYLDFLKEKHIDIYSRLTRYMETIGDKKITRVPINPALNKIPDELIPLIDSKLIVYKNCSPMYLALESFGLSTGIPSKKKMLFVDIFGVDDESIYGTKN